MRTWGRRLLLTGSLLASSAFAKKIGFGDSGKGVTLGGGLFVEFFDRDSDWDPVPKLAPTGTDISGSGDLKRLPLRAGFFLQRSNAYIEPYLRYILNTGGDWTASGGLDGDGTTSFASLGGGLKVGVAVHRSDLFQVLIVAQGEAVSQRVTLGFDGDDDPLSLGNLSLMGGGGLQPELWLADLWSLSVFVGYLGGQESPWEATKAGTFLGVDHAVGALKDSDGNAIRSKWGGFLIEATMRLNFYL